jgi:hypothetical protein
MLRRVALLRTDVSEESGASFIRVTRIGELGTTQAVTSNRRTVRRLGVCIPEDDIPHSHRRENLKSYIVIFDHFSDEGTDWIIVDSGLGSPTKCKELIRSRVA